MPPVCETRMCGGAIPKGPLATSGYVPFPPFRCRKNRSTYPRRSSHVSLTNRATNFLSVASERGRRNQWQEKVPHDGVSPPRDNANEYESSDTTPCFRGIFVLHPVEANLLATRSTRSFFPRPPPFNGLFCVEPSESRPKPTLLYPNNAAMGFPPSVIGTGRDALTRSFAGLMPRAA